MAVGSMSNDLWRWADPDGQQRRVRLDELRAALAGGHIAPNTPVWRSGWKTWQAAHEVPELTSSALSAANGVVPNIPPPPLAMVAMQHEFEAKAGVSFSPPPMPVGEEEPPPPPHFVPLPVRPNSIPPGTPSSGRLPSVPPRAPGTPSSPPGAAAPAVAAGGAPFIPSSLPTTIGLPAPPEMLALAAAAQNKPGPSAAQPTIGVNGGKPKDPMIEELSGSVLLEESGPQAGLHGGAQSSGAYPQAGLFAPQSAPSQNVQGYQPPTDPIIRGGEVRPSLTDGLDDVAGLPPRRPGLSLIFDDLNEIKAGRPPKNKLLLAVIAIVGLSVIISLLALVVSLFRGKPSELPQTADKTSGSSSAMTSAAPPKTADSASVPPPVPAPTAAKEEPKAPAAAESSFGDCTMAGEAHVVSPRAFVGSGVEAVPVPGAIALGFAVDPRNGVGVTVDPGSIGITTTVKNRAFGGDAKRMSPVLEKGKLTLVPGVDKKIDKLQGRRVVGTNPPIDLGVAENAIVWAPHDQSSYAKLFPLDGDGVVDAIRAVPLASKGIAVTFRRGNTVFIGVAKGDAVLAPEGSLERIQGLGQIGSPAIATSGDTIFVAWSDRANAQEAWQVRWTKLTVGGTADPPKQLALPEGGLGVQAMSPSMAALGGGRFLMAWSEGTPAHQVRAVTLNAEGTASGAAFVLSAPGINAGQPQVAVGPDGRGVVAFLAAKGKAYEIHATPVMCAPK